MIRYVQLAGDLHLILQPLPNAVLAGWKPPVLNSVRVFSLRSQPWRRRGAACSHQAPARPCRPQVEALRGSRIQSEHVDVALSRRQRRVKVSVMNSQRRLNRRRFQLACCLLLSPAYCVVSFFFFLGASIYPWVI